MPGVVMVCTDDESAEARPWHYPDFAELFTPAIHKYIRAAGTELIMWCDMPLCGPSRAVLPTNQCSHNNTINGNDAAWDGDADIIGFKDQMDDTVFTALAAKGVRIGIIGKPINGLERVWPQTGTIPPAYPGVWTDFTAHTGCWHVQADTASYQGFTLNMNGEIVGPFLSDSWEGKGSSAGTVLTLTEFTSNAHVVRVDDDLIEGATAGTLLTQQLTSTEPGGAFGGLGTYRMSISQNHPAGTTFKGKAAGETLIYATDLFRDLGCQFLDQCKADGVEDFLLIIYPDAPHGPSQPAARHKDTFKDVKFRKLPNVNIVHLQAPIFDGPDMIENVKADLIRKLPFVNEKSVKQDRRDRMECLRAVDEMWKSPENGDPAYVIPAHLLTDARPFGMGFASHPNPMGMGLIDKLKANGQFETTLLWSTTDNGFGFGSQNAEGKELPFDEEDLIHCYVSGLDVRRGVRCTRMTQNTDVPPTLLELWDATLSRGPDGKSLWPLLRNPFLPKEQWRKKILIECSAHFENGSGAELHQLNMQAIRDREWLLIKVPPYPAGPCSPTPIYADTGQPTNCTKDGIPGWLDPPAQPLTQWMLFNLVDDWPCLHNRYGCVGPPEAPTIYADVFALMQADLEAALTCVGDECFLQGVDYPSTPHHGQKNVLITADPPAQAIVETIAGEWV